MREASPPLALLLALTKWLIRPHRSFLWSLPGPQKGQLSSPYVQWCGLRTNRPWSHHLKYTIIITIIIIIIIIVIIIIYGGPY